MLFVNGVNYIIFLQSHQKLKNIQMKNGKIFSTYGEVLKRLKRLDSKSSRSM